jgi:hypothetical protein
VSATGFPLTLFSIEGRELTLSLAYPQGRYESNEVREWVESVHSLLLGMASEPTASIETLLTRVPPMRIATDERDDASFVAPRTDLEFVLAALWRELLGAERVGVHDDFFLAGGHSLLVTQLASRVRDELQAELPLRAFFEAPTVAGMAMALEAADPVPGRTARIAALLRRVYEMSASDVAALHASLPPAKQREMIS